MPNYSRGIGALFDAAEEAVAKVFKKNPLDQEKLALQYPELGAPVLNVDKKTGKEFLGKGFSDEETRLSNVRTAINKNIIEPGLYDPIFPEADRYYADPSSYELAGNTLTATLPKKQATIDKHRAAYDTPEVRQKLLDAYDRGAQSPDSKDWYAMGQLQDAFVNELGPEEGLLAYKNRFADPMAATTGGADPGQNMLTAHYGNYLRNQGESPPGASYKMPHPIGGRYVTGNMEMYDKVINQGQGLTAEGHPKRHNFSANFLGDRSRATIDEQMTMGMIGKAAPPGGTYGILEDIMGQAAKERGVQPANFQDVAWAGFKGSEGKPMIRWVNEMVERTSRVTGKTPQEVLRGFIRGDMPMYGLGGAAALGALEEEDPYAQGGIY